MKIKKAHQSLVAGEIILVAGILLAVVMRLIARPDIILQREAYLSSGIQFILSLSLLLLNNEFMIIKKKTYLPTVFFLLFSSYNTIYYNDLKGSIAAFSLFIGLFFVLNSYQKEHSQFQAFNVSLFLTIGSMFWPPLIYLFPMIWYGFYKLMSFNVKTFLSSVFGILGVYLFVLGWCLYADDYRLLLRFLPSKEFVELHAFNFSLLEIIVWAYTLVLLIISGISTYMFGLSEKIRTVKYLQYLFLLALYIFAILMWRSDLKGSVALVFYLPASLVIAYHFTTVQTKFNFYFLIFSFLFYIAAFAAALSGSRQLTEPLSLTFPFS